MASLTYEQRQSNAKAIALELCGQSENNRYKGKIYGAVDEFLTKVAESASPQSVAQLKAVDNIVKADVLPRLAKAGVIEYLPSKKEDVICKIIGNSAVLSYLCIANTSDLDTETLATLYSIFQKAPATATSINYKDFAEIVDPNTPFQWSLSSDAIDNEMISRIKKAKSIGLKTITGDEEEQPAAPAEPTAEPVAPATEEPKAEEPVAVEQPKAEEPVTIEQPKAEEPVTIEQPKAEETVAVEEPKAEEPVTIEQPKAEEPVTIEEPKVEEPVTIEQPKAEEPVAIEQPKAEEPVAIEQPKAEETIAIDDEIGDPDNITADEPAAEIKKKEQVDQSIEKPKAEEPVNIEEPAPVDEPTVQEPIPENLKHNDEDEVKPEPKKPRQPIRFQLPEGFGKPTSAAIWNTPVITDFGYPFLNFSSEAIQHLFKTKDLDDKKRTFKNIKKMLKVAKKRYGGIWKAIYGAPLELFKKFASDPGTLCVPNYLKVDADILDENSDTVSVAPIKYFSVDPDYQPNVEVPRAFLENFYDVLDFTKAFKTYVKYADGLTMQEFYEEICDNDGKCPFYLLVPKQAKFSRTDVSTGSLFSALFGGTRCIMLKTIFKGKRGCFLIDKKSAKNLYSDIN